MITVACHNSCELTSCEHTSREFCRLSNPYADLVALLGLIIYHGFISCIFVGFIFVGFLPMKIKSIQNLTLKIFGQKICTSMVYMLYCTVQRRSVRNNLCAFAILLKQFDLLFLCFCLIHSGS